MTTLSDGTKVFCLRKPEDIIIGGWDICSDDLYTACKKIK